MAIRWAKKGGVAKMADFLILQALSLSQRLIENCVCSILALVQVSRIVKGYFIFAFG